MHIRNEFILIAILGVLLVAFVVLGEAVALSAPFALLRATLGLAFVLFIPGYTLQAALFPRAGDLDGPERAALSFGLSVAVVPPIALVLDTLPWGIRLWPIVVAEELVIAACSLVAWFRRRSLPEEERFVVVVKVDLRGWWADQDRTNRILYGVLAGAFVIAAVSATFIVALPKPGDRFTEFYILGPEGLAENYPRQVVAGRPVTVTVGITNREGAPAWYRVDVVNGEQVIGQVEPVLLDPDVSDERPITFAPSVVGDDVEVAFLLYRGGEEGVYRSLRLWLEVTDGS